MAHLGRASFSDRSGLHSAFIACLALAAAAIASPAVYAQNISPADLTRAVQVHELTQRVTQSLQLWPGFRPDTIPVLYTFPDRGQLITRWRGSLPEGFVEVAGHPGFGWRITDTRGATNTSTQLGGRAIATIVVDDDAIADQAGIAAHEAFHAFEHTVQSDAHYMGVVENSFLVTTYPVFDTANLAETALEGKLLAAALRATTVDQARTYARQFSAVRDARHRRLGAEFSEFENKAELNEGLAEYVQRRVTAEGEKITPVERLARELDALTDHFSLSFRLRFYRTGPAMALLLDRLEGDAWKKKLTSEKVFLSELVARASGARDEERYRRSIAMREQQFTSLNTHVAAGLEQLRALRIARADSILAVPGITFVLKATGLNWCGFDPQNLLHASPTLILHTRWVRVCGSGLDAQFHAPVVDYRAEKEMRAVIGQLNQITITSEGRAISLQPGDSIEASDVKFEAPGITGRAAKVRMLRDGNRLIVTPLR